MASVPRQIYGSDPYYTKQGDIGAGSFGNVYRVMRNSDRRVFACKSIKYSNQAELTGIASEVQILKTLAGCPNIAQLNGDVAIDYHNMRVSIYMQYYPNGNLLQYIQSHQGLVAKEAVTHVWYCIAMALSFCHSRGILHKDIKPQNILITQGTWNGQNIISACLADFGVGKFSQAALFTSPVNMGPMFMGGTVGGGTYQYMAPEQLQNQGSTQKTDIFSLGCVMFEMCNKRAPFVFTERHAVPAQGANVQQYYGPNLSSFVGHCMALNPWARVGTNALLQMVRGYMDVKWTKQGAMSLQAALQRPTQWR